FPRTWNGVIDEVQAFNRALSATEIRAIFAAYSAGECKGSGADLTVSKTHTANFSQGQTGAGYTITVTNVGQGPTLGTVTATDTLPTALTATAISGTGWNCTLATLSCTRTDALLPTASYPAINVTVNVAPNAAA